MKEPTSSDDVRHIQYDYERGSEVMLNRSLPPLQTPQAFFPVRKGSVLAVDKTTLALYPKPGTFSPAAITSSEDFVLSTANNSHNASSITINYEHLSREFFQTYDPSVGLHTAVVLGTILVWLVLYVVYRTKIRKCVVQLVSQVLGEEEDPETKMSSSEEDSTVNNTMVRALINPNIVIESSPPESSMNYENFNPRDCFSPYSNHGTAQAGASVFTFSVPDQAFSESFHQDKVSDKAEPDIFLCLLTSQMDASLATTQWVHNTPLVDRSKTDFASLKMWIHRQHRSTLHRPNSYPVVCLGGPQYLPLLDIPCSWSKSLPNSTDTLSDKRLDYSQMVVDRHNYDHSFLEDDFISVNQKWNRRKRNRKCDDERAVLVDHEQLKKPPQQRRYGRSSFNMRTPAQLNLQVEKAAKGNHPSEDSFYSRLPVPLISTVAMQTSKHSRTLDCESNTTNSSGSSADLLLASSKAAPKNFPNLEGPNRLSPHHLSPFYIRRQNKSDSNIFSWSNDDIHEFHNQPASYFSSKLSAFSSIHQPHPQKNIESGIKKHMRNSPGSRVRIHWDNNRDEVNTHRNPSKVELSKHRHSCSDYTFDSDFLFISSFSSQEQPETQRNQSKDIPFSATFQTAHQSPPIISLSPTPYLLQVPDPNKPHPCSSTTKFERKNKNESITSNCQNQLTLRTCVDSDSDIADYSDQCLPFNSTVKTSPVRRHTTCASSDSHMSSFDDSTVRPLSSTGSFTTYKSYQHRKARLSHRNVIYQQNQPVKHDLLQQANSTWSLCDTKPGMVLFPQSQSAFSQPFSEVVKETKL